MLKVPGFLFLAITDFAIHLDPVVSYLWSHPNPVGAGHNHIRSLVWQVAVYTLARNLMTYFWKLATALKLVTRETTGRKVANISLWQVNVMAGGASHLRLLKAATSLQ